MKKFMLKTLLLIALMCVALLYGMEVAKDNMLEMKGLDKSETSSSLLDFNIPGLTSHPNTKEDITPVKVIKTPEKSEAKETAQEPTIEDRIQHLNDIKTFNPFSSLGEKFGEGVSTVFSKGMSVTTTAFDGLIKAIL